MNAIRYTGGEHWAEPLVIEAGGQRRLAITLEAGARLHATAFVLAEGKAMLSGEADGGARLSLTVDLVGPGAEFHLHALYVAGGVGENAGHADIEVSVNHMAPDCTSRQLIKGIAAGSARGAFTGKVLVAPDAQRTDATQRNQNLQLTDEARIEATPALEIYADDVRCSHGATVGQLDPEAIYYMRQRGVSEEEAHRLQLQGFAAEIVAHCPPGEASSAAIGERIARLVSSL
jgi:Fe-S cluster assembly protein SufD